MLQISFYFYVWGVACSCRWIEFVEINSNNMLESAVILDRLLNGIFLWNGGFNIVSYFK